MSPRSAAWQTGETDRQRGDGEERVSAQRDGGRAMVPCRFFAKGFCAAAASCPYRHERATFGESQDKLGCHEKTGCSVLQGKTTQGETSYNVPQALPLAEGRATSPLELDLDTIKRSSSSRGNAALQDSGILPTAILADLGLEDRSGPALAAQPASPSFAAQPTNPTPATQHIGEPRFGTMSFAQLAKLHSDGKSTKAAVSVASSPQVQQPLRTTAAPTIMPELVQKSSDLCAFAMVGKCRYGTLCRNTHGIQCPRCCRYCLHPTDMDRNEEHIEECLRKTNVVSPIDMHQVECGLCGVKVAAKGDPRFGLLNCDHAFCLYCIRTWRAQHNLQDLATNSCPLCREVTFFVVPSSTWTIDKAEKLAIIETYKRKLGQINCKYFSSGDRTCPFGNSCFYSHRLPGGSIEQLSSRSYFDKDERQQAVRETRLCDFINFKIV